MSYVMKKKVLCEEKFIEIIKNYYGDVEEVAWESQNQEYFGCIAKLKDHTHRIRLAKITPKKIGQFVAVWEKDLRNTNQPFLYDNSPEYLSIFVFCDDKKGVFIFPKKVIEEKGIYSSITKEGKMGFRLYPDWDNPGSLEANKTKKWQIKYFKRFF